MKKYLIKSLGVAPSGVYAVGYSSKDPAKSAANSAKGDNQRRAVITLTTKP